MLNENDDNFKNVFSCEEQEFFSKDLIRDYSKTKININDACNVYYNFSTDVMNSFAFNVLLISETLPNLNNGNHSSYIMNKNDMIIFIESLKCLMHDENNFQKNTTMKNKMISDLNTLYSLLQKNEIDEDLILIFDDSFFYYVKSLLMSDEHLNPIILNDFNDYIKEFSSDLDGLERDEKMEAFLEDLDENIDGKDLFDYYSSYVKKYSKNKPYLNHYDCSHVLFKHSQLLDILK